MSSGRGRLAALVIGLAAVPLVAKAETYVNARFGYALRYPAALLAPQPEAENGDGRRFLARRGSATLSVWGAYRAADPAQSPKAIARAYEADCAPRSVTYEAIRPTLVAFSCRTPAGRILYQKTLLDGEVARSVRFDYPADERATWDRVVEEVSASHR